MDSIGLSPSAAVLGVLLVVLVLVLVVMIVRRRRAQADRSGSVAVTDGWDGLQSPSGSTVSREQRRMIESLLSSTRGTHGRHAAVSSAPSGVLMLLVPIGSKRRARHGDTAPRLVSIAADSIDDIEMLDAEIDREPETAVIVVPRPADADRQDADRQDADREGADRQAAAPATEDLRTYQRRVATTIQAIGRHIGPGELPEVVEARMLAAVERLDGPLSFARPALSPAGPRRSVGQLESPAPPAQPVAPPAPPAQPVAPPAPPPTWSEADRADEPAMDVPPGEPPPTDEPAEDEPEVVLPVPPSTTPTTVRRRGFRPRGKAG